VICLGIGGQIERGGEEMPPRSTVHFEAQGTVSKVSHKFLEDGTVEETTVLTVVASSFAVLEVEKAAEQPELPLTATQPSGPVTAAETDAVAEQMGLQGPLLVACEGCGHGKGDHETNELGEHVGHCLNPSCQCTEYVAFGETPAEEELEPVGFDEGIAADTAAEAEAEGVPA
jgi:hypothetical protein